MSIAGESENIPSWVADWPHCCDFVGDTCDGLRGDAMVLDASKSQQNAPFHRIVWPGLNGSTLHAILRHRRTLETHHTNMLNILLPIFAISLFIFPFSNGLQHYEGDLICFHAICISKLSVKCF